MSIMVHKLTSSVWSRKKIVKSTSANIKPRSPDRLAMQLLSILQLGTVTVLPHRMAIMILQGFLSLSKHNSITFQHEVNILSMMFRHEVSIFWAQCFIFLPTLCTIYSTVQINCIFWTQLVLYSCDNLSHFGVPYLCPLSPCKFSDLEREGTIRSSNQGQYLPIKRIVISARNVHLCRWQECNYLLLFHFANCSEQCVELHIYRHK